MPDRALLKIYARGDVEVELVATYLADFKSAYDSILVFETVIDATHRSYRDLRYQSYPFGLDLDWHLATRRIIRRVRDWPPTRQELSSLVPRSEQLVLASVSLQSPGFWEFLGKLNPLEVARQYLNDRHERRKDRKYRESAEERRMALENLALENKVLQERIKMAKDLGASDRDLAPLLNSLVYRPLVTLDHYQDKGVIENAEILTGPDHQDG